MDVQGGPFRACATSALRGGKPDRVIQQVAEASGIEIELIPGKEERTS